jgi:hypothetical protein
VSLLVSGVNRPTSRDCDQMLFGVRVNFVRRICADCVQVAVPLKKVYQVGVDSLTFSSVKY